jgi:hypothetical protein
MSSNSVYYNTRSTVQVRGGKEYVEPKAVVPIDDREGDGNFAIIKLIDEPQQQDEGNSNNNASTDGSSSVKSKRSWWPF